MVAQARACPTFGRDAGGDSSWVICFTSRRATAAAPAELGRERSCRSRCGRMGADELLDARLAHCVERAVVGGCFCSVAATARSPPRRLENRRRTSWRVLSSLRPGSGRPRTPPGRARTRPDSSMQHGRSRPKKCRFAGKPSGGLEPPTPSLPWRFGRGTRGHLRVREGTFSLQIDCFRTVSMGHA